MIAGPSEILILADDTANPEFLAADLMSQAEHDPLASSILLTTSARIAEETIAAVYRQIEGLSRKDIINQSLDNFGAVMLCSDMEEAVEFANALAPEHLEVCAANPMEFIGKIDNADRCFSETGRRNLWRLLCRAEPCASHQRDGALFLPAFGGQLRQEVSFIYYTQDALMQGKGGHR